MGQPNPPADPGATPPAPTTEPAPTDPPATGDGLGEAGKKALAEERAARKELEKQLKALQDRDPVKDLLAKLGQPTTEPGTDPTVALQQRIAAMEERTTAAELKAMRLEVAAAKGFTADQAARLQGATREELEADADRLRALFPTAPTTTTPGVPAPDPTQGARGGSADREALIKEAQSKGDWRTVIRLQNEKLADAKPA